MASLPWMRELGAVLKVKRVLVRPAVEQEKRMPALLVPPLVVVP